MQQSLSYVNMSLTFIFVCMFYTKFITWTHNGEAVSVCIFHLQNYFTDFD
jgi:hypothetical protein